MTTVVLAGFFPAGRCHDGLAVSTFLWLTILICDSAVGQALGGHRLARTPTRQDAFPSQASPSHRLAHPAAVPSAPASGLRNSSLRAAGASSPALPRLAAGQLARTPGAPKSPYLPQSEAADVLGENCSWPRARQWVQVAECSIAACCVTHKHVSPTASMLGYICICHLSYKPSETGLARTECQLGAYRSNQLSPGSLLIPY